MKLEDMKPGLYRLTTDVKNPRPDRRSASDWRDKDTWHKGLTLYVRTRWLFDDTTCLSMWTGRWSHKDITFRPDSQRALKPKEDKQDAWLLALLDALEPIEPRDITEALTVAGEENRLAEAVDWLIRERILSQAVVVAAARRAREEAEADEADEADEAESGT